MSGAKIEAAAAIGDHAINHDLHAMGRSEISTYPSLHPTMTAPRATTLSDPLNDYRPQLVPTKEWLIRVILEEVATTTLPPIAPPTANTLPNDIQRLRFDSVGNIDILRIHILVFLSANYGKNQNDIADIGPFLSMLDSVQTVPRNDDLLLRQGELYEWRMPVRAVTITAMFFAALLPFAGAISLNEKPNLRGPLTTMHLHMMRAFGVLNSPSPSENAPYDSAVLHDLQAATNTMTQTRDVFVQFLIHMRRVGWDESLRPVAILMAHGITKSAFQYEKTLFSVADRLRWAGGIQRYLEWLADTHQSFFAALDQIDRAIGQLLEHPQGEPITGAMN